MLTLLVGPTCVGKTTIWQAILDADPKIKPFKTCTDRPMREWEKDSKISQYHFLTPEEFTIERFEGHFFEVEKFAKNMYGTRKKDLKRAIRAPEWYLGVMDINGALAVKEKYHHEALTFFLLPPSIEVLKERLLARGSETEEQIALRLERAVSSEIPRATLMDCQVVNENIDETVKFLLMFMNNHKESMDFLRGR